MQDASVNIHDRAREWKEPKFVQINFRQLWITLIQILQNNGFIHTKKLTTQKSFSLARATAQPNSMSNFDY